MIAQAKPHTSSNPAWHARFLAILPTITRQARIAFCGLDPEKREDAMAEVTASTFTSYARLVELDKEELAFPTPLVQYAIRHYHDGRRIGSRQCNGDVYARRAQRRGNYRLKHIGTPQGGSESWRERITENFRTPIPDQVQFRIDFPAWLSTLKSRDRRITLTLAEGERTSAVAKRFGVSASRVSQLRSELCHAWHAFIGELPDNEPSSVATGVI